MTNIHLVTGNQKKFAYITSNIVLPADTQFIMTPIDTVEIQAPNLADVSRHKAVTAWEQLQQPLLAHDSGMAIPELNGYPGPYTKDLMKTVGVDRLFNLFAAFADRSVVLQDCLTYIDQTGIHQFSGNTADIYCFAKRKGQSVHSDMPLNSLIAFCNQPDVPLSEIENWMDVYQQHVRQKQLLTCWQKFSDFIAGQQYAENQRGAA